jgi:hypothetical protein
MSKVQKSCDYECYTPPSEPFRFYFFQITGVLFLPHHVILEAFSANECGKIFSGTQPCQCELELNVASCLHNPVHGDHDYDDRDKEDL